MEKPLEGLKQGWIKTNLLKGSTAISEEGVTVI